MLNLNLIFGNKYFKTKLAEETNEINHPVVMSESEQVEDCCCATKLSEQYGMKELKN